MKAWGGVITAAVFLILVALLDGCVGIFLVAIAVHPLASIYVEGPQVHAIAFAALLIAFAVWWIATGVGLIRLRCWARYSMLVIAVAFSLLGISALLQIANIYRATSGGIPTEVPGGGIARLYIVPTVEAVILLAFSIWWFVYFIRRRVGEQFRAARRERDAESSAA